ncbi:MAG TPA: hypothetical protein VLB49_02525 [Gemmatimonadales bacterium]|nr:hypothetical protein [Gemmatimonadales bacterium]
MVLLLGLAWLLFGGRGGSHEPTAHRKVNEEIDYTELEQAERVVRDADDEDSVRDWGPGAGKPRPPHLL